MGKEKIGRNQPCPCGSGKKYKHCCGSYSATTKPLPGGLEQAIKFNIAQQHAKEIRRRQQQGLGKPIISTEVAGRRIVAVKNRLYTSPNWKTFHDFLFEYLQMVLGREWITAELRKDTDKQHAIVRWIRESTEYHKTLRAGVPKEKVTTNDMTPALRAYMGLAYSIYLLRHNSEVQQVLINRVKSLDPSASYGAMYEAFVAATFVKGGYAIAFENERDGRTSHCEFVATEPKSGTKFSVEAKSRFRRGERGRPQKMAIRGRLENAIGKKAGHPRVVFIDVNVDERRKDGDLPDWAPPAIAEVRDVEITRAASEQPIIEAYVFLTNGACGDAHTGTSMAVEGFNIRDIKHDSRFPDLRAALESREKHWAIHDLIESIKIHSDIPSTFGGEIPDLAFAATGDDVTPLIIGRRYLVPDASGTPHEGLLEDATMDIGNKKAYGVYLLANGKRVIATSTLTDQEVTAYKKYPDTFFGVPRHKHQTPRDMIDWYDFFHETYRQSAKEKLLEFMSEAGNIDYLRSLTQADLARIYCERLALSAFMRTQEKSKDEGSPKEP